MKIATTVRQVRLSATVWGDLLLDRLQGTSAIDVRRKDGSLATIIDRIQARLLCRYRMIAGRVSKDHLQYLVLLVPKSVVIRVLRMDPARPGEITPARQSEMQWAPRYDRAKLGRMGSVQCRAYKPPQKITEPVPGLLTKQGRPSVFQRRIVA